MTRRLLAAIAIALVALTSISLAGCSSDTKDKAKDAVDSAKEDAKKGADKAGNTLSTKKDEAQARATAEELRVRMKESDTADAEGVRSVKALNDSVSKLAGNPTVTGIEDGNGDGLDDDGKVQVDVNDSHACLTLPATGENTEVKGGAC